MSQETQNQDVSKSNVPSIGRLAVPVWILMVAVLLGYRGCVFVDNAGGSMSFSSNVFGPYRGSAELDLLQPSTGGYDDAVKKGRALYSSIGCAACHQANGLGMPGAFPALAGSEWVLDEGHQRVVRIVLHGLNGPITVKGVQLNSQMPGLPQLSDAQIANILTFVKNAKEWGNETGEWITPEMVTVIRDETADRTKQWPPDELASLPNK